ncbi:MAG: proprotein convertase P-domain-containing protein [Planctomycetota bacterium]|jgi:subtilisin-like proprotein convertase family protein
MVNALSQKIMLFSAIVGISLCAAGEPAAARRPASFAHRVQALDRVQKVVPAPIDLKAVQAEDRRRQSQGAPFRFAIPRPALINPLDEGTWEQIDEETWLWRLRIFCPGAQSLNLGFTRYRMPKDAALFIYSADEKQVLGPFTDRDNEEHGQLWTPVVLSDDIVVEVTIRAGEMEKLELELTSINHGYRGFEKSGSEKADFCNVDVACSAGDPWGDQIRSVGVYSTGGSLFCSGALINNTAEDNTPYFLTADHCNINGGNAASMVVYWNYQRPSCGSGRGSLSQYQTGAYIVASYRNSDFKLVLLDDEPDPSFNVYFAGWNRSSEAPTSAVCIHHPDTDEKSISIENDPTCITGWNPGEDHCGSAVQDHIRVGDWDLGTTESGSSGGPLFDANKLIVGQLHGGYARCGNDEPDWFGRFYTSWTGGRTDSSRLSNWLDPLGTGTMTLDGKNQYDPKEGCKVAFTCEDVPVTIPDPGTAISTMRVAHYGEITDFNVRLDISHTYDSDLDVFLIAPDGTRIELFTDVGGSGNDYSNTTLDDEALAAITDGSAPFAGAYRPEGNLSTLDGKTVNGTWTLEVTDDEEWASGTLNSWSLIVKTTLDGDFEPDCDVDYSDLDFFASHWLSDDCDAAANGEADWCDGVDIDKNTRVDFIDYAALADNWLTDASGI